MFAPPPSALTSGGGVPLSNLPPQAHWPSQAAAANPPAGGWQHPGPAPSSQFPITGEAVTPGHINLVSNGRTPLVASVDCAVRGSLLHGTPKMVTGASTKRGSLHDEPAGGGAANGFFGIVAATTYGNGKASTRVPIAVSGVELLRFTTTNGKAPAIGQLMTWVSGTQFNVRAIGAPNANGMHVRIVSPPTDAGGVFLATVHFPPQCIDGNTTTRQLSGMMGGAAPCHPDAALRGCMAVAAAAVEMREGESRPLGPYSSSAVAQLNFGPSGVLNIGADGTVTTASNSVAEALVHVNVPDAAKLEARRLLVEDGVPAASAPLTDAELAAPSPLWFNVGHGDPYGSSHPSVHVRAAGDAPQFVDRLKMLMAEAVATRRDPASASDRAALATWLATGK